MAGPRPRSIEALQKDLDACRKKQIEIQEQARREIARLEHKWRLVMEREFIKEQSLCQRIRIAEGKK